MNPAVLTAFALAIIAGGDAAAYADLSGVPRDQVTARKNATDIGKAADELRRSSRMIPVLYVSESNYFEPDWQHSSGAQTIRGYAPLRRSTIQRGCFLFTTVSAAKSGVPTASPDFHDCAIAKPSARGFRRHERRSDGRRGEPDRTRFPTPPASCLFRALTRSAVCLRRLGTRFQILLRTAHREKSHEKPTLQRYWRCS